MESGEETFQCRALNGDYGCWTLAGSLASCLRLSGVVLVGGGRAEKSRGRERQKRGEARRRKRKCRAAAAATDGGVQISLG